MPALQQGTEIPCPPACISSLHGTHCLWCQDPGIAFPSYLSSLGKQAPGPAKAKCAASLVTAV